MIVADTPSQQPFVDALGRALDKVDGKIDLLEIDGRQHIVALFDTKMKFFQLGLLVGTEARNDLAIQHAISISGKAMVTRADGLSCGYWLGLTGHREETA